MPNSSGNGRVPAQKEVLETVALSVGFSKDDNPWRLVLDAALDAVIVMDATGNVVDWNGRASTIFGWTREETLGRNMAALIIPSGLRDAYHHGLQCLLQSGKGPFIGGRIEISGLRKSGEEFPVELSVSQVFDGDRLFFVGFLRDLSEHKRAEEKLRESERVQRELVEQLEKERTRLLTAQAVAKVGSWETNLATLEVTWSAETFRIFETSSAKFVHTHEGFLSFVHPDDRAAVDDAFQRSFKTREICTIQHRLAMRNGRIKVVCERWQTFVDSDGKPSRAIGTCQDITQHLDLEEQLRQSLKMEAVGLLTGGIAHDFNNVLTIIMAKVEALEEEDLGPDVLGHIGGIRNATLRAADLTRQLLAYSRKQPLRPQRTNINDLVTATGELLRRTLGEQVEIAAVLADDLWTTNVDRAQLETALINLCINARDAMPEGGRLLIETRNEVLDGDYVACDATVIAGNYVMLAVSDTGTGMPPEVLAKVFDPFFTTKEVGKGTGLGLSMVYSFIKQSHGHIEIDSEVGRGTLFKLYLPRDAGVQEEMALRQRPAMLGGSERILVVEDDPEVRASVVQQLQGLGYAVSESPDGAAGVTVLEAASPPLDLLLTDVGMPGPMNGRALVDEVARRWPRTKVVFMSGYSKSAIVHSCRLDEGVLLLSKPFLKRDLAGIIRQALDGSAGRGPAAPTSA